MRTIQLMDGRRIDPTALGFTSVHEHVVPYDVPNDKREEIISHVLAQLDKAYSLGVRTIIDVSPRLNLNLLLDIIPLTPMQIVGCTGFYIVPENVLKNYSVYDFLSHILYEFENGIQGSGVLPGVIKIGSRNENLSDWEIRALTAAGIAQKMTGLPLCVHSCAGCDKQQKIFEEAGADLSRVYFSHTEANFGWEGRTFEEEVKLLEGVMEKGSFLSFNNFNNWTHTPEDCLADLIKTFAADGYSGKLLATMDYVATYNSSGKLEVLWEDICSDGAARDYSYIISHVVPWMRSKGIDEDTINAMNYANPVKLFG